MQRNVALSIVVLVFLFLAALEPIAGVARDTWLLAGILVFMWVSAVWQN